MKELKLIIYPPVPPNPRPAGPLTRMSPEFDACMAWDGMRDVERRLMRQKRLTQHELAAECWQFMAMHRSGQGLAERYAALERFATLPDYDR
ncbi:hypothetical protein [Pseudarthrobacter sp. SSS035]|uniref:hypothetical protein n=1 Tax=Pseudarthrobacter sp. SSS035 TaxID=2931399 RepID=UPI00200C51B8|nr:hypothetical protein [Pseudarthrobacter sp. SSS035]